MMIKRFINIIFLICFLQLQSKSQSYSEILGRPTDSSITISVMFDQNMSVYWDFGTTSGVYNRTTAVYNVFDSIPLEVDFTGLSTNTKYYYRIRYRSSSSTGPYAIGPEHTFRTRRPRGSTFSFAVEADPHLDTNCTPSSLTLSMQNMLAKNVDFMIDLGDNFLSENFRDPASALVAAEPRIVSGLAKCHWHFSPPSPPSKITSQNQVGFYFLPD